MYNVLLLISTQHHKANGHVEVRLHTLLTSVLDGGVWSPPLPSRFIRGKDAPETHQCLPRLRECFKFVASLPYGAQGHTSRWVWEAEPRFFLAPRPHRLCAPAGTDSGGKAAEAWRWLFLPLTHKTHKRSSHEQCNVTQWTRWQATFVCRWLWDHMLLRIALLKFKAWHSLLLLPAIIIIIIIIIIVIILSIITCMQGIYNYIPETKTCS